MSLETTVLTGAAVVAAYLDAKYSLWKDINQLYRQKIGERNLARAVRQGKGSNFFLFEDAAGQLGNAPCIWSRCGEFTWTQAYENVCRYANFFLRLGVTPRSYVGVYLYNSPELLFVWLGLLSIGAAPALINYNLAADALTHCVKLSGTRFLLCDEAPDCVSRLQGVRDQLAQDGVQILMLSKETKAEISQLPPRRPQVDCFHPSADFLPFALMYTSGTTGLPKAFPLTVARNYQSASLKTKTFGQRPGIDGDRTYYCIPLYHGTGGIAAMNDLMSGISIAVAPKFSLSRFWVDCIESKSTVFVYVGEIVRYLLSAPPSSNDRQHQIRLIWGNGLGSDVWQRFQERFGVPEVGEFFASTEGVMGLVNHYRSGFGLGAVGHHGWLLRRKFHDTYVPVETDPETGDISRSPSTGFARRKPYEEGGEILVKLPSKSAWSGYFQAEQATQKKLVENVFQTGDIYYRTGDSLRRDSDGLWYFVDRLGDTYRWKGENVSTTEVALAVGKFPGILEASVYGVELPHHDGRAGCAAVVLSTPPDQFDWQGLVTQLQSNLPPYAVPVFIRVRKHVGSMSTDNHKYRKTPLREEGVNPDAFGSKAAGGDEDHLFWLQTRERCYIPFARQDWERLRSRGVRL